MVNNHKKSAASCAYGWMRRRLPMLDEIREKYRKETYTSIITKTIRNLYDITCRVLIRSQ